MEHSLSGLIGVLVVKAVLAPGTDPVAVPQPCMEELSARAILQKRIHCVGEEIVALTPLIILDAFKRTQETIQHMRL